MNEEIKPGRERRRRRFEERISGKIETQMALENMEQNNETHVAQSSRKLLRRDTFTVMKSKNDFDVVSDEEGQFDRKSAEASANDSDDLKNFTFSVSKASEETMHETYNIDISHNSDDKNEFRPVPAPRRRLKNNAENDKLSSDTDRDVTEIDLDDLRLKYSKSDSDMKSTGSSNKTSPPVPKPRRSIRTPHRESEKSKESPSEILNENSLNSDSNNERSKTNELPLIENLQEDSKDTTENSKTRKLVSELFNQNKKRKRKSLASMMKLEKKKIPRISAILKDLKEDEKEGKMEEVEDKSDFQLESPRFSESVPNGQIYVQSKRGFYLMERDELFKNGKDKMENEGNSGMMEDSTVETAILFQKYWSRSMIYFHGILAGFAFSHAATITGIMMHYDYEPQPFISVYSCLSLKIHYVFYALICLCIVSCFDRLDIGHINRKHLQVARKAPSMWIVLCFYLVSFGLSFSNHAAETRFESLAYFNETNAPWVKDEQVSLLQWYHKAWAQDVLVLCAWLLVSLTEFPDFLSSHLNNMVRYAEVKSEGTTLHRLPRHKPENL